MKESKVIAVCNQKGGVGKTTTTVNVGIGLAKKGHRVLLVDCDPQASLTTALGYNSDDLSLTISEGLVAAMQDTPVDLQDDLILHHEEGIDLIPANITLAATELSLVTAMSRETTLKRFLKNYINIDENYDYVLIDCLPSLGMIMQNALTASNKVLVPVAPNYLSATGMVQLLGTIERIKRHINPDLSIAGVVLTIVDPRTKLAQEIIKTVNNNFGEDIHIFSTYIPRAIKTAEAPVEGKSIYAYDPSGKVAHAYAALTEEVTENV